MRAVRPALVVPPLAVAAVVVFLLVRGSRPDPRVRAEEDIRSRWSAPAEFGPLSKDVARYLAEHGESAEARWFAAEAYVRIGEPARAQATVLDHAATARAADAPRRFSILLLRQLSRSGPLAPRAKMIRAEVDDEGARDELKEVVASMRAEDGQPPPSIVFYFRPAVMTGEARQVFADLLRAKEDEAFRLAGATLATGPADRRDVDLLVRRAIDPAFRRARAPTWRETVRALGGSRDPKAAPALRGLLDSLPLDAPARERLVVVVGLALDEQEDAVRSLLAEVAEDREAEGPATLYARGLGVRLSQGDDDAAPRMAVLWKEAPSHVVRLSLAFGGLLADRPPPASLPVAGWLEDLERAERPIASVAAAAYRWRTGEAGARERLLSLLSGAIDDPGTLAHRADGTGGPSAVLLEVLRTFVRWP